MRWRSGRRTRRRIPTARSWPRSGPRWRRCLGRSCSRSPRRMAGAASCTAPSGGSQDAMTLAIAHGAGESGERGVLDCVREVRPPFSPDAVVAEFAGVLRAYGLAEVTGDAYGGEWPRERFAVQGIEYRLADE